AQLTVNPPRGVGDALGHSRREDVQNVAAVSREVGHVNAPDARRCIAGSCHIRVLAPSRDLALAIRIPTPFTYFTIDCIRESMPPKWPSGFCADAFAGWRICGRPDG